MTSFAILLVAMSTVGFAYSGWRDQVNVEGVVHMGEFIVGILTDPIPDWTYAPETIHIIETTNGYYEDFAAGNFVPKTWVADTDVTLTEFRTSVHHDPVQQVAHNMHINVVNAYPQYGAHVVFLLKNAGTVPAHIRLLFDYATVEGLTDPVRILDLLEDGWYHNGVSYMNHGYIYDPVLAKNVIEWWLQCDVPIGPDPDAIQLEPCNHYKTVLAFEFKQDAQECHTYKFGVTIDAIQWNMDYEWDLIS